MSSEKDYLSLPLQSFLTDLAAKAPTPGGGSVAALVGAVATSQARMVLAYTVGRADAPDKEAHLRELLDELDRGQEMFGQLMSEDMAAYERYATARKSDDPAERQRAIATAVTVPMEVVVLASAVGARLDEIKGEVNPYLYSDWQVSAILAFAAARSAALNVRANLRELADHAEAERLENQLNALLHRAHHHRSAVVHYRPV
jgi:formiminotetrahydrofolate cyclodeaminase